MKISFRRNGAQSLVGRGNGGVEERETYSRVDCLLKINSEFEQRCFFCHRRCMRCCSWLFDSFILWRSRTISWQQQRRRQVAVVIVSSFFHLRKLKTMISIVHAFQDCGFIQTRMAVKPSHIYLHKGCRKISLSSGLRI